MVANTHDTSHILFIYDKISLMEMREAELLRHKRCVRRCFCRSVHSEEYKLYSACLRKPSSQLRVIGSHLKFPAFIRYIQTPKT
jgi:hypothetical protein